MRIWIVVLSALILFGCKKEQPDPKSGTNPPQQDLFIEILSPQASAVIENGADTLIHVFISDALSLHEYSVSITDSSGNEYFYEEGHTHFPEINLNYEWINTVPPETWCILHVVASNHKGEIVRAERMIYSD